jgi:hypothetical protein
MCQVRLFRTQALGHLNSFLHGKVGHMRTVPQPIQDQNIKPLKLFLTFDRDFIAVRAISDIADAKTKHLKSWAMLEPQRSDFGTKYLKRVQRNGMEFQAAPA